MVDAEAARVPRPADQALSTAASGAARPGGAAPGSGLSRTGAALALVGVALLALAVRAQGFEWVFVDDATVVFPPGDAHYHARRALQAWLHFPRVPLWDSYINFPDGAAISWPPLYDFLVAAAARVAVRDPADFARFAAWVPPFVGAAAILPVYALGRRLGTRATGVGAALVVALLPLSVTYSRVGQLDHHAAVALLGAWLLLATAKIVGAERASASAAFELGAARIAMLLTWHGSLLYLALVDATLWVAAAVLRRRDVLAVQAGSAAAACLVVAPIVLAFPEPLGGAWSAIALSRLHVAAMLCVALVGAALYWIERPSAERGPRSTVARLAWTAGVALAVALLLLLFPGPREGLEPGLRFLTMTDAVGARTGEQLPLFDWLGRPTGRPAIEVFGFFAWILPLLPVGVVLGARPDAKRAAWVVAAFCLYFGALAVVQRRYGNDLGPALAVAASVGIGAVARRAVDAAGVARRWAVVPAAAIGLALLAPPLFGPYRARTASAVRALQGGYAGRDMAAATVAGSLTRFLEQVRRVTPETAGFSDAARVPEYGVVADPNLGHAVQNVAHRPTPTDPFWSFIGQESWDRAADLLSAADEARALDLSEELGVRYVVAASSAPRDGFEGWLYESDGLASGDRPRSRHLRLVTEGPRRGVPLSAAFDPGDAGATPPDAPPYKLFEIVNGALLEIAARPGDDVRVVLSLTGPARRKIVWRASEKAGPDGVARIRVVHSTDPDDEPDRVRATGLYVVSTSSGSRSVGVSERDVRTGATLRIAAP